MSAADITIAGIYPPVPTFFHQDESLDLDTQRMHIERLRERGIVNIVALGSNGEAVHLDRDERRAVIGAIREAAGAEAQILAGVGAQSTRETIALCQLAADAGADVALALPPSHYGGKMGMAVQRAHFLAVADASPLPVMVYNMPANAAGIDLDAETVISLSTHPNIIGMKDSSGNVTKMAEVAAGAREGFTVLAGSAGFLLPAMVIGAQGAIAALANIAPRECLRLLDLYHQGKLTDARALQARLIPVNTAVTSGYGVAGLKAALQFVAHYGGEPRRPLAPLGEGDRVRLRSLLAQADLLNTMRPGH
ncbi:MAG TPA: dihydrodipicolinate synthase family protein [Ktedonobacterales bacterium]|jgi:4-hydroxy-2-oxoglutarate aldolase|nr:dihydrodipicolinate synthase family protein [Ktedonobacterales bacterium]